VIENRGYAAARIYIPKTFMNITRGLMGNWSNDKEDDLTPRHAQDFPVPISSTSERIYREFGLSWMVSDSGDPNILGSVSLFHHENRRSSSFYNDRYFNPEFSMVPILLPNMTFTAMDVERVCGADIDPLARQCSYDYIVTQNEKFAQVTKMNADNFYRLKMQKLRTVMMCGKLETPRFGRKSTAKRTIGTEVKFECARGYILSGESKRVCHPKGEWSPGSTTCIKA